MQIGEVDGTPSSVDDVVHQGAHLHLYTAVNRKSVEMPAGGSDVIVRSKRNYAVRGCVLYSLQRSHRRFRQTDLPDTSCLRPSRVVTVQTREQAEL